jgi:hypothetical protein
MDPVNAHNAAMAREDFPLPLLFSDSKSHLLEWVKAKSQTAMRISPI